MPGTDPNRIDKRHKMCYTGIVNLFPLGRVWRSMPDAALLSGMQEQPRRAAPFSFSDPCTMRTGRAESRTEAAEPCRHLLTAGAADRPQRAAMKATAAAAVLLLFPGAAPQQRPFFCLIDETKMRKRIDKCAKVSYNDSVKRSRCTVYRRPERARAGTGDGKRGDKQTMNGAQIPEQIRINEQSRC